MAIGMKAPSTALLRAFLRPTTRCSQIRHAANWMPRERYAKITSLDKLHRKQKANNRLERQNSAKRANSMLPPSFASPSLPDETSTPSSSLSGTTTTDSPPSHSPTPTNPAHTPSVLPYHIHRTRTQNFPIYESHKAGGSKHITTIRKCAGDLNALQSHILDALKLEPSFVDPRGNKKHNVVINRLTNQLVVRGWRAAEIKRWCELVGF